MTESFVPWITFFAQVYPGKVAQESEGMLGMQMECGLCEGFGFAVMMENVIGGVARYYRRAGADPDWIMEEAETIRKYLVSDDFQSRVRKDVTRAGTRVDFESTKSRLGMESDR